MISNTRLRIGRLTTWAEHARQDASHAWRALRRSPGVTLIVVLVLALGLGANSAMFSLLDQVFLRVPAGVDAPQEIRRLYYYRPTGEVRAVAPTNSVYEPAMYPEYTAVRASAEHDVQFAAYVRPDSVETHIDNAVVSAMRSYVTQSYFTTLRVRPALGRFFTADDDRVDVVSPAAVISDAFWHRVFAGEPAVLGRQIHIADRTYSVVGVAPRDFNGIDLDRADLWLALGALPTPPFFSRPWYRGGFGVFRVFARIPSTVAEQKVAAMATVAYRRARQSAGVRDTTSTVLTGPIVAALGPADRRLEVSVSLRLAGVSLILLLIAIGNVANLLLVRGMRRRREIAIRRALGVSTARLCWQLMSESLLLSTLGAAAAVIIGAWGSMALRAVLLPETHWSSDTHFARAVAFTVLVSVVTGTLAGMAPVFHATGLDLTSALKAGVRSSGHRRRVWTRSALTIGQVALSVVLLVGAGLFVRSLRNVRAIDLGFDSRGLVAVHARFRDAARNGEVRVALESVAADVGRLPNVQRVAMASSAPMQGAYTMPLFLPGRDSVPEIDGTPPFVFPVSTEYFATLGVRLVAGRTFTSSDRATTMPVAVVGRTFARVIWPGENPLGKCIRTIAQNEPCTTVVGVVDDSHVLGVIEPHRLMQLYLPLAQTARLDADRFSLWSNRVLLIRTRPGAESAVMQLALRLTRERLPGADVRVDDMTQVLEPELRPWRLGATLFSALGVLAAIVAVVGMYGVIAYAASQRAHEMGVRMALGARARDILTLVAREGLRIVLVSVAIGIIAAIAMGRLVASLLYGVSTHDPVVLTGAAVLLASMGFAAILTPAVRAARIDPASALRAE